MKNMIEIDGEKAILSFDPEIALFRGEFIGLSGGADFYAASVDRLVEEGQRSLKAYLDLCAEKGVEPHRSYSGRFNLRLDPSVHEAVVLAAAAEDKSLNEWIATILAEAARAA